MDINKYRLFLKIAEFNNITAAAKAMNYTQSTASHAISSLEQELGIRLLLRNNTDILRLCEVYDFHPRVAFTLPDDFSLLTMAENGLGCTILPSLIVSNYHHRAAVKTIAFDTSRTVGFATRAREALHPRVGALLSITQSLLSSFGVEQIHSSPIETDSL